MRGRRGFIEAYIEAGGIGLPRSSSFTLRGSCALFPNRIVLGDHEISE